MDGSRETSCVGREENEGGDVEDNLAEDKQNEIRVTTMGWMSAIGTSPPDAEDGEKEEEEIPSSPAYPPPRSPFEQEQDQRQGGKEGRRMTRTHPEERKRRQDKMCLSRMVLLKRAQFEATEAAYNRMVRLSSKDVYSSTTPSDEEGERTRSSCDPDFRLPTYRPPTSPLMNPPPSTPRSRRDRDPKRGDKDRARAMVQFRMSARYVPSIGDRHDARYRFRIFDGRGDVLYVSETVRGNDGHPNWRKGVIPLESVSRSGGLVFRVYCVPVEDGETNGRARAEREESRGEDTSEEETMCVGVSRTTHEKLSQRRITKDDEIVQLSLWDPDDQRRERNDDERVAFLVVWRWRIRLPSRQAEKLLKQMTELAQKHAETTSPGIKYVHANTIDSIGLGSTSSSTIWDSNESDSREMSDSNIARSSLPNTSGWSLEGSRGRKKSHDKLSTRKSMPARKRTLRTLISGISGGVRQQHARSQQNVRRSRWRSNSGIESFQTTKIKPGKHHRVTLRNFSTLKDFHGKLKRAKSKGEFVGCLGNVASTQSFLSTNVQLHISPYISASMMRREVVRFPVVIGCKTYSHDKTRSVRERFDHFRRVLIDTIKRECDAKHFTNRRHQCDVDPVFVWVCQNLSGNRVGDQAFNALKNMIGVDIDNPLDMLLCDSSDSKDNDLPPEIKISGDTIEVSKMDALTLMHRGEQEKGMYAYSIVFHVLTHCKLLLETKEEMFRLKIWFNTLEEGSANFTFDPEKQIMLALNVPKRECPYLSCAYMS